VQWLGTEELRHYATEPLQLTPNYLKISRNKLNLELEKKIYDSTTIRPRVIPKFSLKTSKMI